MDIYLKVCRERCSDRLVISQELAGRGHIRFNSLHGAEEAHGRIYIHTCLHDLSKDLVLMIVSLHLFAIHLVGP